MSRSEPNEKAAALQWRRTKIVATLGPASNSSTMIEDMIAAGVDVVRVNMSHGDPETHRAVVRRVRRAASRAGLHVAVLMDLCGPKIRVGKFADGAIELAAGQAVVVTTRKVTGRDGLIPSQYPALHKDVQPGERILLDDGRLALRVEVVEGSDVHCRVEEGGLLSNHKGMNLPNSRLSAATLTRKDREDAALAVELGVDFVALSFVRSARDVEQLGRLLKRLGSEIPVISKIERPEAVDSIEAIMDASFGIMIARGDLGIELPAEKVPLIQRDLIALGRQKGVPVIVATQMLESMMQHLRPTRAEVTDVAGAALLGADAAMLSGETAVGRYPLEAMLTMDRVLREVEAHQWRQGSFAREAIEGRGQKAHVIRESMAHAAVQLAQDLDLDAIVVPTRTGTTARIVSAHRPLAPTLGACAEARICRRMALHWGIVPVQLSESQTTNWRRICRFIARRVGLGRPGHDVLLASGFHDDPATNEPVLKLMHM
ncbi:MAG: pyruvate kinase [Gammaproteobacteria bacterium]